MIQQADQLQVRDNCCDSTPPVHFKLYYGDMQTKKAKISASTGLPPLLSPRTQIDPNPCPNMPAFRSMSSVKKQSIERKEENRPVTDNTQKQKTYSISKSLNRVSLFVEFKIKTQTLQKLKKQENWDQIVLKLQSPAVRIPQSPFILDSQEDTIIKEEVQQSENQENQLANMKNFSSSGSQKQAQESSLPKVQESSSNSQFEFSETPTFTEGEMIGS